MKTVCRNTVMILFLCVKIKGSKATNLKQTKGEKWYKCVAKATYARQCTKPEALFPVTRYATKSNHYFTALNTFTVYDHTVYIFVACNPVFL